jgi:hypothetical protein
MPPSTARKVRTPATSFTVPTVYRVTAAPATTDRPGSTARRAVMPADAQARRSTPAHSVIDGVSSPSTYATPSPPPSDSSGRPSGPTKPASASTARAKLERANTLLPMWAWTPTRSTAGEADARSTAVAAAPVERVKPNFESS